MDERLISTLTRRDLLKLGGTAVAVGAASTLLGPKPAEAQTPKRGGIFHLRQASSPSTSTRTRPSPSRP